MINVWSQGSHDIQSNRDMRDALGALGPVDGVNPELSNLTCSLTLVEPGDIVFITSDGISDNFDPVVGKFCIPKRERPAGTSATSQAAAATAANSQPQQQSRNNNNVRSKSYPNSQTSERNALPEVEAYQRHELTLLRMEDLLNHGSGSNVALTCK